MGIMCIDENTHNKYFRKITLIFNRIGMSGIVNQLAKLMDGLVNPPVTSSADMPVCRSLVIILKRFGTSFLFYE